MLNHFRKISQVEKMASDGLERASKLNFVTNDLSDQLKVKKKSVIILLGRAPPVKDSV